MKKIKKGDKVKVISGKDRGRTGSVVKVLRKKDQAIVKGINLVKKHLHTCPLHIYKNWERHKSKLLRLSNYSFY